MNQYKEWNDSEPDRKIKTSIPDRADIAVFQTGHHYTIALR